MTLEARERDLVLSFLEVTGTARVPMPVGPDDAASKAYVDGLLAGLSFPTQPEIKATTTTLVVEEVDQTPRISVVERIQFDQADGFVLTNPSAKTARIDLADLNAAVITAGILAVARGGTGLGSGTSGGVLAFTAAGTVASSTALTANALVVGGGAGVVPSVLALSTGNRIIGMNAGATANEYKTLASADASVTIVHTAGNIDFAAAVAETGSWTAPARALNTTYQNTTGTVLRAQITLAGATGGHATFRVDLGSLNPPAVHSRLHIRVNADASMEHRPSILLLIPNNWYYNVRDTPVAASGISEWLEKGE